MKRAVIVSGGKLNQQFASNFIQKTDFIIGVDGGAKFLYEKQILPDVLIGDFDTLNKALLEFYKQQPAVEVIQLNPEKDATDTEMAIRLAVQREFEEIAVLGAIGGRMDHTLGNIQTLHFALDKGKFCYLIDEHNCIYLKEKSFYIKKADCCGVYISLFPAGAREVKGITLKGMKYPLTNYTLTGTDSLCVSNEIVDEKAAILFESGRLIVIESKD